MVVLQSDGEVVFYMAVMADSDGRDDGLNQEDNHDQHGCEVRNASIDRNIKTGEQPGRLHTINSSSDDVIIAPTGLVKVLQARLGGMARREDGSHHHLEEDEDSLDERMSSVPENVAGPLLGQDLLAVHVAHKLLLIELYGQPQSGIFHGGRIPQQVRRAGGLTEEKVHLPQIREITSCRTTHDLRRVLAHPHQLDGELLGLSGYFSVFLKLTG